MGYDKNPLNRPWRLEEEVEPYELYVIDCKDRHVMKVPLDDAPVHDYNDAQRRKASFMVRLVNSRDEDFVSRTTVHDLLMPRRLPEQSVITLGGGVPAADPDATLRPSDWTCRPLETMPDSVMTRCLARRLIGGAMTVRAKVHCSSVTKRQTRVYDQEKGESVDAFVYDASFFPVTGDTDENKRFFAATPSGQIQLGTMREDQFEPGKSYYVDFTPVED